jgi:hypothetical protein
MARRAAVARKIVLFIQSSFVYSISKWPALVFSNREVTRSVQNRNVKVFIILMIFNNFYVERLCVPATGP